MKANSNFAGGNINVEYDPPYGGFAFSLSTGKSWSSQTVLRMVTFEGGNATYTNTSISSDFVVGGKENVTVPAGTFEAYNVTTYSNGSRQNGSIIYYSEAVGNVIRTSGAIFGHRCLSQCSSKPTAME